MSVEESTEAPNWLVKLEEQRERRLKVKLGHEAGAGAPCQTCGDKCPGLDLHFWRKICKICKCGKEEHDIGDDDIYGFVQFQLLGSKPLKAKNIFLPGKKDAVNLDWTPKGANKDVKRYLEEMPEHLLPIAGSEAAKLRKQRLQRQTPAHDIDASLCHALSPEEIEQLEDYVAHIRKHSVGQGKIVQIPILRGDKHKLGEANSQFMKNYTPAQLASSQTVSLQPSDLANNLHNLSLQSNTDKNVPRNRAAFLHSQIPCESVLSTIDEQNPETTKYTKDNMKVHPNYVSQSIHRVVDNQNPIPIKNPQDKIFDVHKNQQINPSGIDRLNTNINSDLLGNIHNPNLSEQYLLQHPEYAAKLSRNDNFKNPLNVVGNTGKSGHLNADMLGNIHDPILSEQYLKQHPEYAAQLAHTQSLRNDNDKNIGNRGEINRVKNPETHLVHGTQYEMYPKHVSGPLDEKVHNYPYDKMIDNQFGGSHHNVPKNPRIDTIGNQYHHPTSENVFQKPQNIEIQDNISFPHEDLQNIRDIPYRRVPYNPNMPYDVPNVHYPDRDIYAHNYPANNVPISDFGNLPDQSVPLPLTTSNVEKHQEQFRQDYPELSSFSDSGFKNRVPIPIFNAENKIHPIECDQNIQSVGYIRDIDYNIPKLSNNTDLTNSNSITICHSCKKLFDDDAIAVSIDRTSSLWHASCFNCRTCKQPLADLLYFYHKETDDIYCGRDYAVLRGIPRCGACDELIFVREYCLAEERTYHIKHFCCFECDEPLAGKQYVIENNQPNCIDCFEKLKAEKCTDCGYVIAPDEQGVSLQELHWHANDKCFVCKHCRKALLGKKLLLRNKNLFCSDVCYKTYFA